MRKRRKLLIFIILVLLILAVTWYGRYLSPSDRPSRPYGNITFNADDYTINMPQNTIIAGTSQQVILDGVPDNQAVDIFMYAPFNIKYYLLRGQNNQVSLVLKPEDLLDAGNYIVKFRLGNITKTAEFRVIPERIEPPLFARITSRLVFAGLEHIMATAFPRDKYGNAVLDDTVVSFRIHHPDDYLSIQEAKTWGGIAWCQEPARPKAGVGRVYISAGQLGKKRFYYVADPYIPLSFTIFSAKNTINIDQEVMVMTDELKDQFGNLVANGTIIEFRQQNPDGTFSIYQSHTYNGIAEVPIVYNKLGQITVQAKTMFSSSNVLNLTVINERS